MGEEGGERVAEGGEGGVEGFDGGESGGGVLVGFGLAGIGGFPVGGDGAAFVGDGRCLLEVAEHAGGVAPGGVEEDEGEGGIVRGQGRGVRP